MSSEIAIQHARPVWVKSVYFKDPMKLCGLYWYGDEPRGIFANMTTRLADLIIERVKSDNQCLVVISGPTSSGKSTIALEIIKELCDKLGYDFILDDMYIYSPEDLARKLKRKCENKINWYDEGSVSLNSLATTSKTGKLFGQFFDTMRLRHFISFLCTPEDSEINKRITKHADLYISCPKKAPFFGFQARGFYHVSYKIIYESGKVWDQFIGTGIFKKLPKKLKEQYEAVKRARNTDFEQVFIKEVLGE